MVDDMMHPGRPIPAELIERYGAEFDALEARRGPREYIRWAMPVTRAADRRRDQARYQAQDMADGSLHLGLIGFQPPTRYAHDLPRSPYYRGAI